MNSYATIQGSKMFSISDKTVLYGNSKLKINNSKCVNGTYVSESPIEIKNIELAQPKIGLVEIRSGNNYLQKNKILNNKFLLEKNAKLYQGATVFKIIKKLV